MSGRRRGDPSRLQRKRLPHRSQEGAAKISHRPVGHAEVPRRSANEAGFPPAEISARTMRTASSAAQARPYRRLPTGPARLELHWRGDCRGADASKTDATPRRPGAELRIGRVAADALAESAAAEYPRRVPRDG